MQNTGKNLEQIVKAIEEKLLREGYKGAFSVKSNVRDYYEDGVQGAEFDIIITFKLGSSKFRWLIECRDHKSSGPQGTGWIQQLAGRNQVYPEFDKITAVSSTGFSEAAIRQAGQVGVELKTVKVIDPADVNLWIAPPQFSLIERVGNVSAAHLVVDGDISQEELSKYLVDLGIDKDLRKPFLRINSTNEKLSILQAWVNVIYQKPQIFDQVPMDETNVNKEIVVTYRNPKSHYMLFIQDQDYRVNQIVFTVSLSKKSVKIPFESFSEYVNLTENETIAQTINYRLNLEKNEILVSIHKFTEDDDMLIVINGKNI